MRYLIKGLDIVPGASRFEPFLKNVPKFESRIRSVSEAGIENAVEPATQILPFSPIKRGIIRETKEILANPEMARLKAAAKSGEPLEVNIGGRHIQYEPGLPSSGFTNFERNGFAIDREETASTAEWEKTVLHELHRLTTSSTSKEGLSAASASTETRAASKFAEEAYPWLHQ